MTHRNYQNEISGFTGILFIILFVSVLILSFLIPLILGSLPVGIVEVLEALLGRNSDFVKGLPQELHISPGGQKMFTNILLGYSLTTAYVIILSLRTLASYSFNKKIVCLHLVLSIIFGYLTYHGYSGNKIYGGDTVSMVAEIFFPFAFGCHVVSTFAQNITLRSLRIIGGKNNN